MIHIVLVHPKMPSNTGNIIRLCANTGASLHLLKPLGFELEDKKLKRAGLDYHEYANLKVYDDWQSLRQALEQYNCEHIVALTTKFSQPFYDYDFTRSSGNSSANNKDDAHRGNSAQANIALVFGSETDGLPEPIRADIASINQNQQDDSQSNATQSSNSQFNTTPSSNNWLRLPMLPNSRSLNLSNSVAICLYEVWRQLGFDGDTGTSVGYNLPNQPDS